MEKMEIKTVVFVSNYFNHHQKPFSEALFERLGLRYTFLETEQISEVRKNFGWEMSEFPTYVNHFNAQVHEALVDSADVVFF